MGISCYGEMLLLSAMHVHTGQFSLLAQLLKPFLGIEIVMQPKMMQRLKTIFTLDLFPEQVLAERAARIPVTKNLSARMETYLPAHCVLQLMKTRTFSKHRVPIKVNDKGNLLFAKRNMFKKFRYNLRAYKNVISGFEGI